MSTFEYPLTGALTRRGDDVFERPDAIEFVARERQPQIDRLGEVTLTVDRWGGLEHIAELYVRIGDQWSLIAKAMPLEREQAFYILEQTSIKLSFSEYLALQPGGRYLVYLPHAVITTPEITLKGVHRIEVSRRVRPVRARRVRAL